MINRNIKQSIINSLKDWPITLVTGSRQIGKTTICKQIAEELGYSYISLDDVENRKKAIESPKEFVSSLGNNKIVIDEVQYAPILFDVLTSIVNKTKLEQGFDSAYGMFILTGSQSYNLMKNVSESMAGRVNIIKMLPLSLNEINNQLDVPFEINTSNLLENERMHKHLFEDELFSLLIKGFFPLVHNNENIDINKYYSNYIDTYISRDVNQLINVKDTLKFSNFVTLLATYSGQEFIKENICKSLRIESRTVDSWIGVLLAGNIISLVQPYYEDSINKRIVKKNKLYFNDTGLLCHLLKLRTNEELVNSKNKGPIFETFIFNEISKSYANNQESLDIYFYRDKDQKEIDFIIIKNGKLNLIEVKSGSTYTLKDVKSFDVLNKSSRIINGKCIISTTNNSYPLKDGFFVFPFRVI